MRLPLILVTMLAFPTLLQAATDIPQDHRLFHAADGLQLPQDVRRVNERALTAAEERSLPPAPAHQRYRVMDGQVVRMDAYTQAIVAVVGPLGRVVAAR